MHPAICGEWEYATHARHNELDKRCVSTLNRVFNSSDQLEKLLSDTRSVHQEWFQNLTPADQDYLAGNYRGADHDCLRYRPVFIAGYSGAAPALVSHEMDGFHTSLTNIVVTFDSKLAILQASSGKKKAERRAEFLCDLSEAAAAFYVLFLVIHPYANGNGHISRLIVWMMLIRAKHHPKIWPLNARPPTDQLILQYRNGDKQPLIRFILKAIRGY